MNLLESMPLAYAAFMWARGTREHPSVPGRLLPKHTHVPSNLSALITLNVPTSTIDQLIALMLLLHHL